MSFEPDEAAVPSHHPLQPAFRARSLHKDAAKPQITQIPQMGAVEWRKLTIDHSPGSSIDIRHSLDIRASSFVIFRRRRQAGKPGLRPR